MCLPIAMFIPKDTKMGLLSEVVAKRTVTKTTVSKAVVRSQYVNPDALTPIGITVPLEKPSIFVDSKERVEKRLLNKDQHLLISAFISKYPHYQFKKKVHSKWTNLTKYWFFNTKTNITHVATFNDIKEELELACETSIRVKEIKGTDKSNYGKTA